MAFETFHGLDAGQAHAWTGRAVTDDHLTQAEDDLRDLVRWDVRNTSLVRTWEQRPLARALAFLAAAIYDAETGGEVYPGAVGGVAVKRVSAGDVTVELADGANGRVDAAGQLDTASVDWRSVARNVLASHGLLADRLTGRTGRHAPHWATSPIVNDI